jgi:hypothetical protein
MTGIQRAPGIAWVVADSTAYVARIPSGPIVVLTGPAAVIWDELMTDGDAITLAARVSARMSDVPPDADATVKQVVEHLLAEGLLDQSQADQPD